MDESIIVPRSSQKKHRDMSKDDRSWIHSTYKLKKRRMRNIRQYTWSEALTTDVQVEAGHITRKKFSGDIGSPIFLRTNTVFTYRALTWTLVGRHKNWWYTQYWVLLLAEGWLFTWWLPLSSHPLPLSLMVRSQRSWRGICNDSVHKLVMTDASTSQFSSVNQDSTSQIT